MVEGGVEGRGGGGGTGQVLLTLAQVEDVSGRGTQGQQEHVRAELQRLQEVANSNQMYYLTTEQLVGDLK